MRPRDCSCGAPYKDHRTGLTFKEVFAMLWSSSDDPKQWRYKRRHTVLGLWHELKRQDYLVIHGHCA